MATDNKISTLLESQVPGYLLEEGPNLVAFLKAYYEWMETTGQVTEVSKNHLNNRDIDTTDLDKFYEYFKREVLADFPDNVLADKRLVAKRIKDLYRAKGSAAAYNLLFRILYNQNVSIYKPGENVLRASDGRWTEQTLIRLGAPIVGNFEGIVGLQVTGRSSGAKGTVISVLTVFESGIEVKQLRLKDVTGVFQDLEIVETTTGVSGRLVNSVGPLVDVLIGAQGTTGGTGHQVGDSVSFISNRGTGANGTVVATTDQSVTFTVTDGGSGYSVGNTTVTITGGNPRGGITGEVNVTSISNTETIEVYTDSIQGLSDTPIGFGPTYSSNSGVISSNLASSNSSTSLSVALGREDVVTGAISGINVVFGNYVEDLPTVFAIDSTISPLEISDGSGGIKGRNAVITPSFQPGSITNVSVDNGGSLYNSTFSINIKNLTRTAINGIGDPVVSGVITQAGNYTGTKGFLSWDQRLQDNYYYQEFSYVIKSQQALKTYRNIVRDVIHPAGTKLFGQIDIEVEADLTGLSVETLVTTDLIGGKFGIGSIGPLSTVGTPLISRDVTVDSIASTLTVTPTAVLYLAANGFIHVSNNNVISPYLANPITTYLNDPVLYGTQFVVQGDGGVPFLDILQGGSQVQITDTIPGTTGNTTYIVNTVFSNTAFSLNTQFTGESMANGTFLYTYDGNV